MPNRSQLEPDSQFPVQAIQESVQDLPKTGENTQVGSLIFTFQMATVADAITPWGLATQVRDRELREFWPTESNLAGAMGNMCLRNAAFDFVVKGPSTKIEQAVTDMLKSALGPPGQIGWSSKEVAGSQDYYGTDNGAFEELIRDPGMDANSAFKAERAPVIGIAHLDSNQCVRTGDPEYPVIYTDRHGVTHKLKWYEVIPFCELPSPIARMNGVGVCAVSRILRAAQIMKSTAVLMDEMIGGRNVRKINIVGGVSRTDIDDAKKRTQEQADNKGYARFIEHVILASIDPEKPVSVATIDLAEFPPDFNYDIWMKWYISTLALGFAVDYQEFAPLPGGNIGSSAQSAILNKKSNAKGQATWMRSKVEAYKTYGVVPRGYNLEFDDRNQAEELERQEIRTKAMEEYAMALRNGVLTPQAVRDDAVRRGIYDKVTVEGIVATYGNDIVAPKTNLGQTGGNTIAESASRTPTGKPSEMVGNRLQKEKEEHSFLESIQGMFSKLSLRKEQPSNVNVTVHNQPGEAPKVYVQRANTPQPKITVNVPRQAAPVVNIKQAETQTPNITVNVPKQDTPQVTVNVPQQAAPQVTVNNTVQVPKKPANVTIEYDEYGKPIGLKS